MAQIPKTTFHRVSARALVCGLLLAAAVQLSMAQETQGDNNMASRMILELQQMREEVRELRGLVEAQSQEIENLKRRQRDQYVDLDRRLGELRAGAAQASLARSGQTADGSGIGEPDTEAPAVDVASAGRLEEGSMPTDRESGTDQPQVQPIAPPEVRDRLDEQAEVTTLADQGNGGARALREPTEAEQQAYDQAFRALRETRYADAAEGFDAFLRDHPDSAYAPNALYWLGEVYYVTRDFEIALTQFERLQDSYPDSSKKPDALLKIGFSHYELGDWDRARAALEQVIADYPGTNYSRLAENRLRTMRLEGNL